ncbi:AraC family transcriptional regulator [Spongiibacter sp. KMU-166]|uniref:AraC family transcriptional regulator n=1 Tax=Spongiibacter thalassae TaxID=2721624 RepID=A0ABX1GCB3_9GAMM|nr:AraC family transcriptional regulator ligand-binding domain-containing protein [Spongiibacter thalassae]NKI16238.1 AraC family transcriptional regulator [Spongiibacter thalassae]
MMPSASEDEIVLHALQEATRSLGIDLEHSLKRLGLSPRLLAPPGRFAASHLLNYLLEDMAQHYHCQDLALHVADKLSAPQLGLPARVLSLSLDLENGLDKAAQFPVFYRDTCYWQHSVMAGQVTLSKPASPFGSQFFRQRNVFGTAQMFMLLRQLTGKLWHADAVSFSFSDPGGNFTQTYRAFFNCELHFNQVVDAIHFSDEFLNYQFAGSDVNMLRMLEARIVTMQRELLRQRDFLDQARLLIDQRLNFSTCTLDELAVYMNRSEGQLSGDFDSSGMTFDALLHQRRVERAKYYATALRAPANVIAAALFPGSNETDCTALIPEG